ncbi:cytochrome P450 [Exidia glandulosa HHB12029]|uniref:Cytochrome P450 n=1 Tax=Exidia glandulosa HHB12029 TaxID=1314781 RepID=A0A165LW44_EXIGL|nr:cytochrome P450 [Exidia glandulosa HHB12029]
MASSTTIEPIPQPPTIPFLGNILDIDQELPLSSFKLLAKQYGDIYQLTFGGRRRVFIAGVALVQEACDESRFVKSTRGPLDQIRNLTGDALFTAHHDEENWGVAHRILMPAFGPASIRNMFDDMKDILGQLVLKWERFGPDHAINPTDDFTRLAFDTLALCVMGYRLNSFYTESSPPFVTAMGSFLAESGRRASRPGILQLLVGSKQYEEDMSVMLQLAEKIVAERRAKPTEGKDLLNLMLTARDPVTGRGLTDKSIYEQMITFLIAGHETSSGFLSFTMYHLVKNPDAYAKLRDEVDAVLGEEEELRVEHLGRMVYLQAVMRESIRLDPPTVAQSVQPKQDTLITDAANGGKQYQLYKDESVILLNHCSQRDEKVWGEDAEEFKPERMLDGKFEAMPPKAWLPFGNGARACIGRPFAWQEVQMCLATLMRKFDFSLAEPGYELHIKQALAVKPAGFKFFARPRSTTAGIPRSLPATHVVDAKQVVDVGREESGKTLHVLYGSNTGSCETFAQRIVGAARAHGFRASIGTMDSVAGTGRLEEVAKDGPVVVVTASFEGEPPDNAVHFVRGLSDLKPPSLAGLQYAVFGCGNHDWVHTYQRIPRLVDDALANAGATRIVERGEADAGGEAFFESFDEWEEGFWKALGDVYQVAAKEGEEAGGEELAVDVSPPTQRASTLRQPDAQLGHVLENRLLTGPGAIPKHHIEIKLPEGVSYRAGDYLAILPTNPVESVRRALKRLGLSPEQQVTINSASPTTLPTGRPVNLYEVLSGYVELAQPATKKNIEALIRRAPAGGETHAALTALLQNYSAAVLEPRLSVLSILESYTDITISVGTFLTMLPAMRVRQYSISSSPLWDPTRVSLTIGVLRADELSGTGELFQGVASTYLEHLAAGDHVQIAVRPSGAHFHLPEDPSVPVVLLGSGSGIAPLRGFIQERAMQKRAGRDVGRVTLFYGCRAPDVDYLYFGEDGDGEMKKWVEEGVLDVRPAFSRAPELSEGCRYVQHRVYHDRELIDENYNAGAKFYLCGSARTSQGIREVCVKLIMEKQGWDQARAEEAWGRLQKERYAADVFG